MSDLKIALVGSAPASVRLAPYQDPAWQIWGCSPGVYGVATRVNEWFELHLWEPGQPWFSPEYVQWLNALPHRGAVLWTGAQDPESPTPNASPVQGGKVLPYQELLAEFDPNRWFCTSSLFWMMAMAIKRGAKVIAFYGVDMAAREEYEMQRAGIHYLTYIARARGIEVGCPPESDLFTPRFRYGIDEWTHSFRKLRARKHEFAVRHAECVATINAKTAEMHFMAGAMDDLGYVGDTWVRKNETLGPLMPPPPAPPAPITEATITGGVARIPVPKSYPAIDS